MSGFVESGGRFTSNPVAAFDRIWCPLSFESRSVTAVSAPGHTFGHHAFLLHDGEAKLLHLMDTAVHYLVGPEEPDWALAVEMDQTMAAKTRQRLFRQAAEDQVLVAGYHFPFPGVGQIIEQGSSWRFVPVQTA